MANNNKNNNNNNNSNFPSLPEDSLTFASPTVPYPGFSPIIKAYLKLTNMMSRAESATQKEIQEFLKQFLLCLFASEGTPLDKWTLDEAIDLSPGVRNEKCLFLGNRTHGEKGCKLSDPSSKLNTYIKYMGDVLLYYFNHISAATKSSMLKDETSMKYFMHTVRNLLYFYGQKQIQPPFSKGTNLFEALFDGLNASFGTPIIKKACKDNKNDAYTCGRLITYGKCNSGNYFVLIYNTESDSNLNAPANTTNVLNRQKSLCGGRRKLRKQKPKRKTRKARKN